MSRGRAALAVFGVVAFLLGVLTVVSPGAAALLPVDIAVAALGSGYALVAAFGVAALIVVLTVLLVRGLLGIDQAQPPTPEGAEAVPYPGEGFDAFVDTGTLGVWLRADRRRRVRTQLRNNAVDAMARGAGCTREEARERIERGTWTDDRQAAAFLSASGSPRLVTLATAALRGEAPFRRKARRAAAEIVRRDKEGWR